MQLSEFFIFRHANLFKPGSFHSIELLTRERQYAYFYAKFAHPKTNATAIIAATNRA